MNSFNNRSTGVDGQTLVILGGTSGIGRTLALGLRELGAVVVPSSRREPEVEATNAALIAAGQPAVVARSCDVTDVASLERLLGEVASTIGPVHALINCAGTTAKRPTLEVERDEWETILSVNLTGTFLACQVFGEHMIEQGYGRILNIGSLASFVGLHQVAAYTASKAGVAGLTRALAVEWAPHGVCVNALAPGVFRTELNRELLDGTERGQEFKLRTPLRRFGALDELIGAAAFLCSPSASFVCGEVLKVDGGFLASGVNQ
ncbi:MAG: SDR family oxidoreductase [Acidobacteriota bacterium]